MNATSAIDHDVSLHEIRARCHGLAPLDARLEPWMQDFLNSDAPFDLVERHGSPVNVITTRPMRAHARGFQDIAEEAGLDFRVFFARKANRCESFLEEAIRLGCGVDVASETELRQCIEQGVSGSELICTAAVKSDSLLRSCVLHSVCVAIDNQDEWDALGHIARDSSRVAHAAIRLGGFDAQGNKLRTRFGFDITANPDRFKRTSESWVRIDGVHFHLDGADIEHRVAAIEQSIRWVRSLRAVGQQPTFLDIGGGFPVSYLRSERQWSGFWRELKDSLSNEREPITYRKHGLGTVLQAGTLVRQTETYPYWNPLPAQRWFANLLSHPLGDGSVAEKVKDAQLQLRCEPGRSLVDGCGVTVARVEFCKPHFERDWLIGLSMNRTQCRTTDPEFLVDPIVISRQANAGKAIHGFFVGNYCTEDDFISWRRFRFPKGIRRNDLVVFPNTAGYQMHLLESSAHQTPLAANVFWDGDTIVGKGS